jgi:hypothetical protein
MGVLGANYATIGSVTTTTRGQLSAATGMMVYNTTTGAVEMYDGTAWQTVKKFTTALSATGGTRTTSGTQTIHTFTSSGEFLVSDAPIGSNAPKANVTVLIVAGGGGGGGSKGFEGGGGGGAGGLIEGSSYPVSVGPYAITVGGGGAFQSASGQNSSAFGAVATYGGYENTQGGSGGGGSGDCCSPPRTGGTSLMPTAPVPGTGTWTKYGNAGGTGYNQGGGGGGGGAGGAGGNGPGGAPGLGRANSITGASVTYARGGGGGYRTPGSPGNCNPSSGDIYSANSGNGGNVCGSGSPGVVIISYPTT